MNKRKGYRVFSNKLDLFLELAMELNRLSKTANPQHISLSGGSTPKAFFRYLTKSDLSKKINWSNLNFWWGDERCVEFTDEQSNFGEAKRLLFDHIDIPDANLHPIPLDLSCSIEDYHQVAEDYANKMKLLIPCEQGVPVYDWIILGVGQDGHTASLFPSEFNPRLDAISLSVRKPETGEFRVSLSASTLAMGKKLTYLVTGEEKASVMHEILDEQGGFQHYPAYHIQSRYGQTDYWLDSAAGSKLKNPKGEIE